MPLSRQKINKGMKDSTKEGVASSSRGAFTNTYLTPFALALGANDVHIGLLSSIPHLASTFVQPLGGKITEWSKSRKFLCSSAVLLHYILWIPIAFLPIIVPLFFNEQFALLLILLSLSAVCLSVARIAWISWTADLVPKKIRGKYFGNRNMLCSIASFTATLAAGYLLGFFNGIMGFLIIFLIGTLFGFVSYFYFLKTPDIVFKNHRHKLSLDFSEFTKSLKRESNFKNFIKHMTAINFAVYLASPFFTVYMLQNLKIGYEWYAIITAAAAVASMISHPYWGKLSDKLGDRTVMAVCNILIIFYPFFWLFVTDVWQVLLIDIFSGFAWAGFDLTTFNYLLTSMPSAKRPICIANYNMFTGIAMFSAPILGGFIAQSLVGTTFLWLSGLLILFFISFVLRALFTLIFFPKLREERVRAGKKLPIGEAFLKTVAIYPVRGLVRELIYLEHGIISLEKRMQRKVIGR